MAAASHSNQVGFIFCETPEVFHGLESDTRTSIDKGVLLGEGSLLSRILQHDTKLLTLEYWDGGVGDNSTALHSTALQLHCRIQMQRTEPGASPT